MEQKNGDAKASVKIRDTGIEIGQVLRMISEGYSYDQILQARPGLTMGDIMASAELARQVIEQVQNEQGQVAVNHAIKFVFTGGKFASLDKVREKHPRAFAPWTTREDNELAEMFKRGGKIEEIARRHRRRPGAIRARLQKLGLIT
jgi:uncharacterized protein (DUF433 family)